MHRIFAPLQRRRDAGDQRGTVEEGEIIGREIGRVGREAGLTDEQLQAFAQRVANPSDEAIAAQLYFPEYHSGDGPG